MTGFDEIWTETVRKIYARIAEAEVIRFTKPDGTTIWAALAVLSINVPLNDVQHVAVYGITENGDHVTEEFWEGADHYPDEIASLIPELIKTAGYSPEETVLTAGDVARALGVPWSQVASWDKAGILKAAFCTPGGHRRYRAADVTRFRSDPRAQSAREPRKSSRPRVDVSTREITRLRDTENLTWKEIGARFRMSDEGVRQRYNRAQSLEPKPDATQVD